MSDVFGISLRARANFHFWMAMPQLKIDRRLLFLGTLAAPLALARSMQTKRELPRSVPTAIIVACRSERLTSEEIALFREVRPLGLILFQHNCASPPQIRSLVCAFGDAVGRERPLVLVDQEGGRVQRLREPYWTMLPSAGRLGAIYHHDTSRGIEAARLAGLVAGLELAACRINMNSAPVLDVPIDGGEGAIGDRAYSSRVGAVAELGGAFAQGLLAAGVLPVMKHIPGHGLAAADSHVEAPRIDASLQVLKARDFEPFRALADLPAAMTAHVVLTDVDDSNPATTSQTVIERIVRREIGFGGLLISDDLEMGALEGDVEERVGRALAAGCDVALLSSDDPDEIAAAADAAGPMSQAALDRYGRAMAMLVGSTSLQIGAIRARLDAALAQS